MPSKRQQQGRQPTGVIQALGPAGVLTGGADVIWIVGSATAATVWNRAQKASGSDILWAIGETFVGGLIAMSVATASEAPTLRNVSLGISTGGAIYLINRLIPQGK